MEYRAIKNLKKVVEAMLRDNPATRNSDIELTIAIWKKYYPHFVIVSKTGTEYIPLLTLFELPREDNIKRARAFIQNEKKKYLPTEWAIATKRGILENEWRVAMGYPTQGTTGTENPSWTPPSEIKIKPDQPSLFKNVS
jgi:hypothetical protein